jgi:hypothetical protein
VAYSQIDIVFVISPNYRTKVSKSSVDANYCLYEISKCAASKLPV